MTRPVRLLDREGLRERGIVLSPTQLWRLEKAGRFPKHTKVGGLKNSWFEDEIDEFLEARRAERNAELNTEKVAFRNATLAPTGRST